MPVTQPTKSEVYTLEEAEDHIADARGQLVQAQEAFQQDDTDLVPNTPTAGSTQFSAAGQQKYVSTDGNAYNTGSLAFPATGGSFPYTVTTSLTTVPGMSAPMGVGAYVVHAQLCLNVPGTAGQGTITYQVTASGGLTAGSGRMAIVSTHAANGIGAADFVTLGTPLAAEAPGTSAANRVVRMQGYFLVTVAGTLNIQIKQAATAAISVVQYGSYLHIFPTVSS